MLRSESIKIFLQNVTHSDLAILYSREMEVQVNVAQDMGERISTDGYQGKKWHSYSDGLQSWYSFRIPKKAYSEPEDNDTVINYDLAVHAEGIGLTGWDWRNKLSRWVAFDFDAIIGHSSKHNLKLNETELREIQELASKIPWVTTRRSTSGNGLHLYVFLKPVPTETHTEHAALARAILGLMSAQVGFDFQSKVDACGGVLWIWHRKMTPENQGLVLIKQGLVLNDIPINWKDHVDVIKGSRTRCLPRYIEPETLDTFDELTGQRPLIKLDSQHKQLLDCLTEFNAAWWWDSDRHMLVCHTYDLKIAHQKLHLRGLFDTLAIGKDHPNDHNAYAFPLEQPPGAWVVRRYTPGVQEALTWDQDASGWTRCYLNREPTLKLAARAHGGMEDEKGAFTFTTAKAAVDAAKMIGSYIQIPEWAFNRQALLKQHKDGRLIIHIKRESTDRYDEILGWREDKGQWKRIYDAKLQSPGEPEILRYDSVIRHVVTETGENNGWVLKTAAKWQNEPLVHIRLALRASGLNDSEITRILGSSVVEGWILTNEPFRDEYPGGRKWNRHSAQFRYSPKTDDTFNYPTWQKVLIHCGKGLDSVITVDPWCKINGILTGADYLKIWVASLFQEPHEPLPYLFFYSKEEQTGKTTFHEALGKLLTKGYIRGDIALISSAMFNQELEGAILCVIEETNVRNSAARNRMKDWVTSSTLMIHPKGLTPYQVPNTTHWIQTGNDVSEAPIFPGDTRITMIHVPPFSLEEIIPRKTLHLQLEREAADFLGAILKVEIPSSNARLNIPVLDTDVKIQTEQLNRTPLEVFLDEETFYAPGNVILYNDFWIQFQQWLDPNELHLWSKIKMGRDLPTKYPKGRLMEKGGQFYVGNISFTSPLHLGERKFILQGDKLVLE